MQEESNNKNAKGLEQQQHKKTQTTRIQLFIAEQ